MNFILEAKNIVLYILGKNKNVSVVPEKEYKLIWGKYNPNRWGNKEIA